MGKKIIPVLAIALLLAGLEWTAWWLTGLAVLAVLLFLRVFWVAEHRVR